MSPPARGIRMRARLTPAGMLRAAAVSVVTVTVTLAGACSDEDTVDTVPPPRPNPTTHSQPLGPSAVPTHTPAPPPSGRR
ncbi:MAG TPA: hypothetical protein VFJ94_13145 [Intrasporangium sp.]|uniref:hypothetical protein n=1 Tax=Intrasporangium sp. TaxID=1925024 RepID=UPI002D778E0D|nr:hypothetical protein [Intrasporangium sp.]HET7399456.1 hypothetical protein [Intrasporangium sp.]